MAAFRLCFLLFLTGGLVGLERFRACAERCGCDETTQGKTDNVHAPNHSSHLVSRQGVQQAVHLIIFLLALSHSRANAATT